MMDIRTIVKGNEASASSPNVLAIILYLIENRDGIQ